MGERISLLVMLSGVALGLYWLGIPAAWVLVLLMMSMVAADFMLLKERRRTRSNRETPSLADEEAVHSAKDDSKTDCGGEGDMSEPDWKQFSKLRVPARRTEPVEPAQGTQGQGLTNRPTINADAVPPAMERAERIRPEAPPQAKDVPSESRAVSQDYCDPLEKYRPEQFDEPARPAPIAESIPVVDLAPVTTPTGPAWVPPAPRVKSDTAPRSPAAPRPPRPVLKPSDFQRNAGKRGFLYLARNPEHWDGLFKVGQTLKHPSIRVGQLNTLHAKHKDIGTFELLDLVEVPDAYGAEQVLFLVLSDLRPVAGREFFIADKAYLSKLMRAVAAFVSLRPEELNDLYRDLDPNDFPAWPGYVQRHYYRSVRNARGWVYLARNQYHKADTYLFGSTRNSPQSQVDALNAGQRTDTPQIGFFTVVFALPVWDTKASRTIGWRALAPWKLHGSKSFVRGPLALINRALTDALQVAAGHQKS